MKIKQTILYIGITLGLIATGSTLIAPAASAASCGKTQTSIISCPEGSETDAESSAVWQLLLMALNIMTAGIGILAVGGIVYGSILYTTAADKAEQTKKARGIITNVVIGIVAYGLMYLVLNFLIPGGIFS